MLLILGIVLTILAYLLLTFVIMKTMRFKFKKGSKEKKAIIVFIIVNSSLIATIILLYFFV